MRGKCIRPPCWLQPKKKSRVIEEGRWKNYIAPFLGEKTIETLTSYDYIVLRGILEKQQLSPQTIYHCLSLLRRILIKISQWTNESIKIPSFKGVMPKFDNRRLRYLTKNELELLLKFIKKNDKNKDWYDITLFAVNTGLRRGEIFNIKSQDISMNDKTVLIFNTKSYRTRVIPLNTISCEIIKKRINIKNVNLNIFEEKAPKIFSKSVKDSGLNDGITDIRQKVVFHTLRHTFASWLVQDGIPLAVVSQLLGHSNINVTMRYAHLAPSQIHNAVSSISTRIEGIINL